MKTVRPKFPKYFGKKKCLKDNTLEKIEKHSPDIYNFFLMLIYHRIDRLTQKN